MPGSASGWPVRAASGAPSEPQIAAVERLRLGDGRNLCIRQWPGPVESTVVLLHGLLDSSEGWTRVCEELSGRRIAFDLPGFGYSDPPRRGTLAGYAADVAEGLRRLGAERFTIVGHSLGGAVAAAVSELVPDRINALVLLAPAGFGRIHLAEAVSIPGVRSVVRVALPFALRSRFAVQAGYFTMVTNGKLPEAALVQRVTSHGWELVDGAREGTRAVVEAGRSRNAFQRRRLSYRGPVYAVWGDRDRLVPVDHRRGVRFAFPQAQIELWPGMGHHPSRERFDDLVTLVRRAMVQGAGSAEAVAA
jgi:pimeloyl-ACP methyl ester carboxylesterase